ncbi:MAG: SufS family cysteine desulfurase [Pseudomonadota bacterium]
MSTPNIRADFPILQRTHNGSTIAYLDNAATTQKPEAVLDAVRAYYSLHNANVHRAAHRLADEATGMLEQARETTRAFINAPSEREIIFTRGTTESINLVAGVLDGHLRSGDIILLTELEHHANIVPWQMLAQRTGARLEAVAIDANGDLDLDDFHNKLTLQPKLFAFNYVSNALGSVNPVKELVAAASASGALTLVDGAQAPLHYDIDVQAIGCDFFAMSGHKMYAPMGIGILYGRYELLEALPPWHGGGEMIETVSLTSSTYQKPPFRYEAGTPNVSGAVGLGAAIEYLASIDIATLRQAEDDLTLFTLSHLRQIPGVRIIGEPRERSGAISFLVEGAHPNDIGTLLDQQNVAVRTGQHCAMPLMDTLGIPGTIRVSFSLYNNQEDAERFLAAVEKATTFI